MATVLAPPELAPKSSFSSVQGWDFYKAVHEAVHADEGSSAARLRNGPATRLTHGRLGMRMGSGGKRQQLRSGLWTKQVAMRTPSGTGRRSKTGSKKLLVRVTRLAPGLTWWEKFAP